MSRHCLRQYKVVFLMDFHVLPHEFVMFLMYGARAGTTALVIVRTSAGVCCVRPAASLASSSALPLPGMPLCAGTHCSRVSCPLAEISSSSSQIAVLSGWFVAPVRRPVEPGPPGSLCRAPPGPPPGYLIERSLPLALLVWRRLRASVTGFCSILCNCLGSCNIA